MEIINLGIFTDEPNLGSGFATVSRYFADYLSKKSDLKIMYFGRWGQERYFKKSPTKSNLSYDYIPCQGGTWDKYLINAIIKHYGLNILLTIDDWWSIDGFLYAAKTHNIPFHFMSPLDSLPIHKEAYKRFSQVDTLYIPNRSWKIIKSHNENINVKYLPYGCDTEIFKSIPNLKNDNFTFLWIGRNEPRKDLRSAILAFEKIQEKYDDVNLLVKTNWKSQESSVLRVYIIEKNLSVIGEQSTKGSPEELIGTYNQGHALLCTSKAGGFELQLLESMACEISVLVTDWNFMNEHVIHGQNGFKVPYDGLELTSDGRMWANIDTDELANYMSFCVNNREHLLKMGRLARIYVQQKYRWKDSAEVLYKSIVGEDDVEIKT